MNKQKRRQLTAWILWISAPTLAGLFSERESGLMAEMLDMWVPRMEAIRGRLPGCGENVLRRRDHNGRLMEAGMPYNSLYSREDSILPDGESDRP